MCFQTGTSVHWNLSVLIVFRWSYARPLISKIWLWLPTFLFIRLRNTTSVAKSSGKYKSLAVYNPYIWPVYHQLSNESHSDYAITLSYTDIHTILTLQSFLDYRDTRLVSNYSHDPLSQRTPPISTNTPSMEAHMHASYRKVIQEISSPVIKILLNLKSILLYL